MPRVGDQRPGEADELALAERQAAAALAELGVVALRQAGDEVVRPDRPRRGARPPRGWRRPGAVADVLEDRAGEEERLLQHHGDLLAERLLRHVAHVVPADQHLALLHVASSSNVCLPGSGNGWSNWERELDATWSSSAIVFVASRRSNWWICVHRCWRWQSNAWTVSMPRSHAKFG